MWAVLLLATTVLAEDVCKQRCDRIHQRSLARVGLDDDKLLHLLETQRPLGTLRDACWRVYDNLDCTKQCDHISPEHENFARFVRSRCKYALKEMENALRCVSRYHSSMEGRCMTFLKEAETLKSKADPSLAPSQKICRYLHLNTLCLENSVTMYCANAKKLFRRLNFRDYFPNFILPSNDTLFDDLDLDSCQMYDFVKQNSKLTETQLDKELTTVINYLESKHEITRPMMVMITTPSTISQERREFTSLLEELLEDSPAPTLKTITTFEPSIAITRTSHKPSTARRTTVRKPITTSTSTTTTSTTTTTPRPSPVSKPSTARNQKMTTPTAATEPIRSTDIFYKNDDEFGEYGLDDVSIDDLLKSTGDHKDDETSGVSSTAKSRLFSEDSWEFTPPNFRYSSMRNGGITPLNIDTSTLFGMDEGDSDEGDDEDLPTERTLKKETEAPKKIAGVSSPKVKGGNLEHTPGRETTGESSRRQKVSSDVSKGSIHHGKAVMSEEKREIPTESYKPLSTKKPTLTAVTVAASEDAHEKGPLDVGKDQNSQETEPVDAMKLPSLALPTEPRYGQPPLPTAPASDEIVVTDPDTTEPNDNHSPSPTTPASGEKVVTDPDALLEEITSLSKEVTQVVELDDDLEPHQLITDTEVVLTKVDRPLEDEAPAVKPDENLQPLSSAEIRHHEQDQETQPSSSRRSQTTIKPRKPKIGIEKLRSPPVPHTSPFPFLRGDVVIKKIHSWNDMHPTMEYENYDDDDDINYDQELDTQAVLPVDKPLGYPTAVENNTVKPGLAKDAADRDTLVLIYSLLASISIFTLMSILICFVWCRKTGHLTITKPLY